MIKINLAPLDEIDSPYWYLPEVIVLVLVLAISMFGVELYLEDIQQQVDNANLEKITIQENINTIKQETARYDQLESDIQKLKTKLDSLKDITANKMNKFKQVIVLEHLQNLKPEGVWFHYIKEDSTTNTVTLVGKAFDNLLIAEMMSALSTTRIQQPDPTDLRTQLYFSNYRLEKVKINGSPSDGNRQVGLEEFSDGMKMENVDTYWTASDNVFPELTLFPTFQLTMQYAERKPVGENLMVH